MPLPPHGVPKLAKLYVSVVEVPATSAAFAGELNVVCPGVSHFVPDEQVPHPFDGVIGVPEHTVAGLVHVAACVPVQL